MPHRPLNQRRYVGPEGQATTDIPIPQRMNHVADLTTQAKGGHVIASSEEFSDLVDRDAIQALHDANAPAVSTIRNVSCLRRQVQFAISHHQEGVNPRPNLPLCCTGIHRPPLPQTSILPHQYLDYVTRIGLWGDVFGNAR